MADKTEKKPGFVARMKGFGANIAKFFRDTKSELKKVVWQMCIRDSGKFGGIGGDRCAIGENTFHVDNSFKKR